VGSHGDANLRRADLLVDRLAGREAVLDVKPDGVPDQVPGLVLRPTLRVAPLQGRADREETAILIGSITTVNSYSVIRLLPPQAQQDIAPKDRTSEAAEA
jgi:hypothetical protein